MVCFLYAQDTLIANHEKCNKRRHEKKTDWLRPQFLTGGDTKERSPPFHPLYREGFSFKLDLPVHKPE